MSRTPPKTSSCGEIADFSARQGEGVPAFCDAADRETARWDLDVNVLVEAGAGTGKTTLLIERLLALLLGRGLKAEELVALTFTKKAASEIRLRLAEALDDCAAALGGGAIPERRLLRAQAVLGEIRSRFSRKDEELLALVQDALRELDRAEIGTIHSFCASLLRLHPLEAGVDPDFRVDADSAAFEELFESRWALWLDAELGEASARRKLWLEVLAGTSVEDLRLLAQGLFEDRARLDGSAAGERTARALRSLAQDALALPEGKPKPRGKILAYLTWAGEVLESLALAAEGGKVRPVEQCPTSKPPSWPVDWQEEGFREYARISTAVSKADPAQERLLQKALEALRPFVEALREDYRRRGWISHDGLLCGARELLRSHARVRAALRARWKALLIDEFQDTDPMQGEILLYLSGEEPEGPAKDAPLDWRSVRPTPGRVFVVGDPKQSIYRFRGADMEAFESFMSHLERAGAKRCSLRTNFRSRPDLIDSINKVFSPLMLQEPGLQSAYLAIEPPPQARADGAAASVRWIAFQSSGEQPLNAQQCRDAEAEWIARWITERCALPGSSGKRPLKDVAVILRSGSSLPAYLEALRRAAIPYVVEGEKSFYAAQEVLDFLNLLRAVSEPLDRTALAGLLRSPLAAFDDAEILRLSRRGELDFRVRGTVAEPLYAALRDLHEQAGRRSLPELVRGILEDTALVELCAAAYHRQQTASNLLKFGRIADAAGERGATLKEFISEVASSVRGGREEGESPLADEHLDAVRILSIHKAKGLEYPVVFVPNLGAGVRGGVGDDAVFVRWSDGAMGLRLPRAGARNAAMGLLSAQERERQRAEELRVLYVAMTRAKEELILLGGPLEGKGASRSSGFAAMIEASGALKPERETAAVIAQEGKDLSHFPSDWRMPKPEEFSRLWRERRAREKAAQAPLFSHPTGRPQDALLDSGFRRNDEKSRQPGPSGQERVRAGLLGQVCHAVLERWDWRARLGPRGETLDELVRSCGAELFRREGILEDVSLMEEACGRLSAFFKSACAAKIASSEILGREVPFVLPQGAGVLRGAMDLVCRDEQGFVVYDFKTGSRESYDAGASSAQGECYVRALRAVLGEERMRFEIVPL
ncbi:MAG: UvrD-helicase domain-containing protein [Elusimicrobiota bacterium]|jgi:ATP-dependent helicase/nuclease subunit A